MSKRQQERRASRAEDAASQRTEAATTGAALAAGAAAARTAEAVQRAGAALEQHGRAAAPAVGTAVGKGVGRSVETAGTARELAGRVGTTAATVAGELVGTVQGLVEEPGVRGSAALSALRGVPVAPPAARRRWPWAVTAAVAGAAIGAGLAYAVRRVSGTDAPGAQEPHELRAVVDVPGSGTDALTQDAAARDAAAPQDRPDGAVTDGPAAAGTGELPRTPPSPA